MFIKKILKRLYYNKTSALHPLANKIPSFISNLERLKLSKRRVKCSRYSAIDRFILGARGLTFWSLSYMQNKQAFDCIAHYAPRPYIYTHVCIKSVS